MEDISYPSAIWQQSQLVAVDKSSGRKRTPFTRQIP